MKKTLIIYILSIILGMIVGFVAGHSVATSKLVKYLDTLDSQYNWIDAFDPCDYYDSRAKLDSLLWK